MKKKKTFVGNNHREIPEDGKLSHLIEKNKVKDTGSCSTMTLPCKCPMSGHVTTIKA